MRRALATAAVLLFLAASPVSAQTSTPFLELSTSAVWSGPFAFSTPDAFEVDRTGEPSRLFSAESSVGGSLGIGVAAAFRAGGRWQIETGAVYSRPKLSVRLDDDLEDAEPATAEESLIRIQVDAGVVVRVGAVERRNQPFVTAGASYLRELHEGQTLAAHGQAVFSGGGIRRTLKATPGGFVETIGLRFEGRLVVRSGGINLDDRTHVTAAATAAVFLRF